MNTKTFLLISVILTLLLIIVSLLNGSTSAYFLIGVSVGLNSGVYISTHKN